MRVRAKITGVHAASGLALEAGQEYEIAEGHFGPEVFEKTEEKKDKEKEDE